MTASLKKLLIFATSVYGTTLPVARNTSASTAACSTDTSGGLQSLASYKTIVALGDGLSDNTTYTWLNDLASDAGTTLKNFAIAGTSATVGVPGARTDLISQTNTLATQAPNLPASSTLYMISIGQTDLTYRNDASFGAQAAQNVAYDVLGLGLSPAIKGTNFLVLDTSGLAPLSPSEGSDSFQATLSSQLTGLRIKYGYKIGYVDVQDLKGLLTHQAVADYIETVLTQC